MGGSTYWDKRYNRGYIEVWWQGKKRRLYVDKRNKEPFDSKERLQRWKHVVQAEITSGTFNPVEWRRNSPLGIDRYSEDWLESIEVSKGTKRSYTAACRNHIVPYFRDMSMRDIRHINLVKFKKSLSHLSSKTVFNVIGTLKTMMKFAYQNEDIPKVPPFPRLGYELPKKTYLTLEQQAKILKEIPERHRPIFQFMTEYGCRPGEARALKKDCLLDEVVIIRRTFSNYELRETTKTGLIRELPRTPFINTVFSTIEPHLSDFVFVTEYGLPYSGRRLNLIWQSACRSVGIQIKLYNGVRHSLASNMAHSGIPLSVTQQTLGHTDSRTTQQFYIAENIQAVKEGLIGLRDKIVKIEEAKSGNN